MVCRADNRDVAMADTQAGGLFAAAAATGSLPAAVPSAEQMQVKQFAALPYCWGSIVRQEHTRL